jgi:hypothetical protein
MCIIFDAVKRKVVFHQSTMLIDNLVHFRLHGRLDAVGVNVTLKIEGNSTTFMAYPFLTVVVVHSERIRARGTGRVHDSVVF